MGMYDQPQAPNPYVTAQAQGAMNRETAIAQQGLNSTNQYTPDGSLTYDQIGSWSDGTPRWSVTQSLSGANQQLHDINQQTQLGLAGIGRQQTEQIGATLATPFDMSQAAINGQTAGMPALPQYRAAPATYGSANDPWAGMLSRDLQNVQLQAQNLGIGAVQTRYNPDPVQVATRQIGSNDALEDQLYADAFSRYQPQLDRQHQDLEADLANRGLRPGSTGYDNAQQTFDNSVNDLRAQTFVQGQQQAFGQSAARAQNDFQQDLASNNQYYNQWDTKNQHDFQQDVTNAQLTNDRADNAFGRAQAVLQADQGAQNAAFTQGMTAAQYGSAQDQFSYGAATAQRTQALNELLTRRQTPMNEITALMGGSQVSRPSWTATPTSTIQPANLEGLVQNNYNQQMQSYNGLMGGLAGLGGTAARGLFALSDRRVKHDVKCLARLPSGLGVYSYRFADGRREIGLLAQEVLMHNPGAVTIRDDGLMAVDYARALEAA